MQKKCLKLYNNKVTNEVVIYGKILLSFLIVDALLFFTTAFPLFLSLSKRYNTAITTNTP